MSKRSRGIKRNQQKEKSRATIRQFIRTVPSVLKDMTLTQILVAYCDMFKCENKLTYFKSLFSDEELKSIIIL